MKRIISIVVIILLLAAYSPVWSETQQISYFDSFEASHNDATIYDWTGKLDILYTLEFGTDTKWPEDKLMPVGFKKADRDRIMEFGKDPGLGVKKLQAQGYTGKGVSVAIIDQPLLKNHKEYSDRDIRYNEINPKELMNTVSSHGPGMTSILVGRETGVVPRSTLYFFANPTWLGDQKNEADAFTSIIELNKKLPDNEKIRVISLSHGVDTTLKNHELLGKAMAEARKNGIIVIDVSVMRLIPVTCLPFKDKDNPQSYQLPKQYDIDFCKNATNALFVPTGGKTIANCGSTDHYFYQTNSGVSSAVPYVAGIIAMGLQLDPSLTQEKAMDYLIRTGFDLYKGKLINPTGFIEMVKSNCTNPRDVTLDKDFKYFLYNSSQVTPDDMNAIRSYISKFDTSEENVLLDCAECDSAMSVYNKLKEDSGMRKGSLKGIQIFGTSGDVPAFDIKYSITNVKGLDEGDSFKSDHFYSNLSSADLHDGISISEIFSKKLKVNFLPEWPVSRLPLTKGEYASYISKYMRYAESIKGKTIPFVDFSSPIFRQKNHSDDTGVLLERMSGELKLINSKAFRLYGNLQGLYPVTTHVLGDFSKESLAKENASGICNLAINSHGQSDNIDKYIVTINSDLKKYADKRIVNDVDSGMSEFRQSLINRDNINTVLSKNYYNLYSRSCLNAYGLDEQNLIHKAMAEGKMVYAIANTYVNSNNGIDVNADWKAIKKNNPAYSYLLYVNSLLSGNSISYSFNYAKRVYAEAVLKNTRLEATSGNYQYQLHNVLVQTLLGLLEYDNIKNATSAAIPDTVAKNKEDDQNDLKFPVIVSTQKSRISYKDDGYIYKNIHADSKFITPGFKLQELSAAVDKDNVYIKIKYVSPIKFPISLRLGADAPGLSEKYSKGSKVGNNIIILRFTKKELLKFSNVICIEVGDEHSIVLGKDLTDNLARN